jgi:hypothetical protein
MCKLLVLLSVIVSGLAMPWLAMGIEHFAPGQFFAHPHQPKHRLVGKLLCEDPAATYLAVMSLHGAKTNAATVVLTDAEGLQTQFEKVLDPHQPLRLSCEDIPVEFSQEAPVFVHVDSRYATSAMAIHVLRGSPIYEMEALQMQSAPIDY